jgi:hypothetical protein
MEYERQDYECLESILDLCPPPEDDNEIVVYFAKCMTYPDAFNWNLVVDIADHGDSFTAVFGRRIATGWTPAQAIKGCLLRSDLYD